MNFEAQKKIAVINDLSGFGRCSLTVALPILSSMGLQCCPVPTAILSNHTGYPSYFLDDYSDKFSRYVREWKKLSLSFDGIYVGYLGSEKQILLVRDFLDAFKGKNTVVILDPVMGDHGKLYASYSQNASHRMKELLPYVHILTPNVTEACILTGRAYKERWSRKELRLLAEELMGAGPDKIVITGIPQKTYLANYCLEKSGKEKMFRTHRIGEQRCGTGDVFSSVVSGYVTKGEGFDISVKKAGVFVKKSIQRSMERGISYLDGVCFEDFLHTL